MKLRIIYTLFIFSFGCFILLSNSGGRATAQSEGNTGAPNDNTNMNRTCQACHNSGSFAVTPQLELKDAAGNIVTGSLNGGETYSIKVSVNSSGAPAGYGFQIVALNAAQGVDGSSVNTWAVPSSSTNVQVATIGNGRQYAEQNSLSLSNEFTVEWVAPSSGDITFYYVGNAVNDNSMASGDNAIVGSAAFTTIPTSTNELEKKVALDIFPNPVQEVINIKTTSQVSDTYDLNLFDINGRQIFTKKINIPAGENLLPIDIPTLSSGIYNLILSDGKNLITKKVVKM